MVWTAMLAATAAILLLPTFASGNQPQLSGPDGTSKRKVLVIGLDGLRWDKLNRVIEAGKAPKLARLIRRGFGVRSQLDYAPPEAATISEVGWCSVASGVWPDKHGVRGAFLNMDPGQATKNGYDDFLTRIEAARPKLSTFLASDWGNIGTEANGGPIFGSAADAISATAVAGDAVEDWNAGDREVTKASRRYIRHQNPDVGFVYLGAIDAAAHDVGSATPTYTRMIAKTDRRVGRLMRAIKRRPTRKRERWTVLVTTDHGQRNLDYGSVLAHGFGSDLEREVFVIGSGGGAVRAKAPELAEIVDIAPTVFKRLRIPVDPGWGLDGRPIW